MPFFHRQTRLNQGLTRIRLWEVIAIIDTHDDPPNSGNHDGLSGTNSGGKAARTYQLGGHNALRCEGGVKFAADTIHVATWQAPGMRAGGEVVPADAG